MFDQLCYVLTGASALLADVYEYTRPPHCVQGIRGKISSWPADEDDADIVERPTYVSLSADPSADRHHVCFRGRRCP